MVRKSGEKFGEKSQTDWNVGRVDEIDYSARFEYEMHNHTKVYFCKRWINNNMSKQHYLRLRNV